MSDDGKLKRSLDLKDLILFGISSILGSGGFNLIGKAVRAGGSDWPAFFSVVAALMMGAAWSYTRAHQESQTNTSESDVIQRVFGTTGERVAAGAILINGIISISVILVFVTELIFPSAGWIAQVMFSTLLLGSMAVFSLYGIDLNKTTVTGFTWILVVVLTAAAGLGGWGALKGMAITDGHTPSRHEAISSLMYFFFILAGFDALTKFTDESRDPEHEVPRAYFGSNAISIVLVFGVAAALFMWVPGLTEKQEANAIGHLFARFLGPSAVGIMRLLMIVFMLVTTFVVFLSSTRYLYGLSESQEALSWLRSLNAAQAPWLAVAVVFAIGFIGLVINHIDVLVRLANGGFIVVMGLVAAAMAVIDWNAGSVVSTAINAITAAGFGGLLTATVL